jgi:ParB-like chromosome segregation protein Spo0J
MRLNELGHGRVEGPKLDPRIIIIRPGFNFRDTTSPTVRAHIDWLKTSIKQNGVQEPIRVEYDSDTVYLVNGECRVIACKELWKEGVKVPYKDGTNGPPLVPAIVVKGDEAEVLASSMIANGALPPTQLEFGSAAKRLMALGWPVERVAEYTPPHISGDKKKAARYVRDAVELHNAPLEVKKAVKEGVDGVTVSPALALQAVRKSPLHASEEIASAASLAKSKGQKVAKRPKTAGKATRARERALSRQEQLEKVGDRMADSLSHLAGLGGQLPIGAMSAFQIWNQLRGR